MVFGETMCPGLVLSPQGFDCGWNIGGVINILINVFIVCLVTQSCLTLCHPTDCSPPDSSAHGDSPGQNTGVGSLSLLQGICLTQELNWGLLHCRWILYKLSYQGSINTRLMQIDTVKNRQKSGVSVFLPPVRGKSFNFSRTRINRKGALNCFSEAGWTSFLSISQAYSVYYFP